MNDHLSASELYQIVEVADPELIQENQLVVYRDDFFHGADYDSVMSDFKVFFYNGALEDFTESTETVLSRNRETERMFLIGGGDDEH